RLSACGNRLWIGGAEPRVASAVPWYVAGRNPAPQLIGPFIGKPRGSGRTTKAGKFLFAVPRPYVTHEPIDGKPGSTNPEFIMKSAGPWTLLLDTIEWMKHMSSTHLARCGKSEETQRPHLPCCLNGQ